jgi:adenylate cyclase
MRSAPVLYAHVAGYSRLTGLDEEGTHQTLKAHLGALAEAIQGHGGRICHSAAEDPLSASGGC